MSKILDILIPKTEYTLIELHQSMITISYSEQFMKLFDHFPANLKNQIRFVLTDIDDTLTINGRLPASVFTAMENLQHAGIHVIPITGRPAGWCDHIARMWPVDGLVGENGAFYFYYDNQNKSMRRRYWKSETQRHADRKRLKELQKTILQKIPGAQLSADQAYREADLAIDFCEDVPRLPQSAIDKIVHLFHQSGATAKISSIHVNGWFGNYDKLSMTKLLLKEVYQINLNQKKDLVLFIGDSPNDCPMFAFFPNAVGVANIREFEDVLEPEPAWVTKQLGGYGFAEMVDRLLS
jgi:HAD superfamily hydrolase (TIGR01484 family)